MLITFCVGCWPLVHSLCRPPLRVLLSSCIRESRSQHNSRETMDLTTGLANIHYEGFWNMAGEDPHLGALSCSLTLWTPKTSPERGLGREFLETKEVGLIAWGGALSRMGVALHCLCLCPWGRGGGECLLGGKHLGALGSCKALLSEFFPKMPCL